MRRENMSTSNRMDEKRRKQLRKRYLRATKLVDDALDSADCGLMLLRFMSPKVGVACREIDAIKAELSEAMRAEGA